MASPQQTAVATAAIPATARRVGLLGGTFNPVHAGHVAIAHCARQQLDLDCIVWIPTGIPPHKPLAAGASDRDRLEMVKLAIANEPSFAWSDLELRRQGQSFAIDTVAQLQREQPDVREWYWIIGLDAIRELHSWHRVGELVQLCDWIVAPRPGLAEAEEVLAEVRSQLPLRAVLLDCRPVEVSSTEIRQQLQQGKKIANAVPAEVAAYIQAHSLYRQP
ncbi:nicotinate-nucleotide adenylyltransferase [Synechococcus sp. PCC 7336]|uniref:nicotinate-nucleotide adenylyltransferase n=1 Tax=Synechococcus sp. PCC 7336 TaxID=195250 RepID=UPI00034533A2|nr:nicotinate-nucleotide adenylyltransferase [Synechococcus sp. PCC 7336]